MSMIFRACSAVLFIVIMACNNATDTSKPAFDWSIQQDSSTVAFTVEGLKGPEAVRYDAEHDVYFIANFNGGGNVMDANGFITRVSADGEITDLEFMTGTEAHPLHAPRGMFIANNVLHAADVQGVHQFDTQSGEQIGFIDFMSMEPGFLNDITIDQSGSIFVTDTGKPVVYRVSGDQIDVIVDDLPINPNGISQHPLTNELVLGSWGGDSLVYSIQSDFSIHTFAELTGGYYDGLEFIDSNLIITSQKDNSVRRFHPEEGEQIILHTPGKPADIGLDTKRYRIAVPYIALNKVDFWDIPRQSND